MSNLPEIHLQKHNLAQNMHRFYRLSIEPDLFGGVLLTRNWGRVGTSGQLKKCHFPTSAAARVMLQGLHTKKRAKGYKSCEGAGI